MGTRMGIPRDVFEQWLGQPVVLQISLVEYALPIRGRILSSAGDLLRVAVEGSWDVEVPKASVLAVEETMHPAFVM